MADIETVLQELRSLSPDRIRERLDQLAAEDKVLRKLLRVRLADDAIVARVADSIGRAEADRYERQFQAIQQSARETKAALDAIEREGQR